MSTTITSTNYTVTIEDTVFASNIAAGTVLTTITFQINTSAADQMTWIEETLAGFVMQYDGSIDHTAWESDGYEGIEFYGSDTITVNLVAKTDLVLSGAIFDLIFSVGDANFSFDGVIEAAVTIDQTPSDIALSAAVIAEDATVGAVVGILSAEDADTAASDLSYTLDDNAAGLFAIETVDGETRLVVNGALDAGSQEVTVTVSDGESSYSETFAITIDSVVNVIDGTNRRDVLEGSTGVDHISGLKGNDKLYGYAGDDLLDGGKGMDRLHGGEGADSFVFLRGDTGKSRSKADAIFDFNGADGDVIDLSGWDANSKKAGEQDFTFIGGARFHGKAGELHFLTQKGDTWIEADTNGDRKADLVIRLDDAVDLTIDHFQV